MFAQRYTITNDLMELVWINYYKLSIPLELIVLVYIKEIL